MLFLAAAATADPASSLLQYGVLGIFAVVLLALSRTLIKREQDRGDRLEDDNKRLNTLVIDKVIPALADSTNAVKDAITLFTQMKYKMDVEEEAKRKKGREEE